MDRWIDFCFIPLIFSNPTKNLMEKIKSLLWKNLKCFKPLVRGDGGGMPASFPQFIVLSDRLMSAVTVFLFFHTGCFLHFWSLKNVLKTFFVFMVFFFFFYLLCFVLVLGFFWFVFVYGPQRKLRRDFVLCFFF